MTRPPTLTPNPTPASAPTLTRTRLARILISAALLLGFLLIAGLTRAQERITNFDVDITAQENGDLQIVETITVVAEGRQIQRGIFRELPRYRNYLGVNREQRYDLQSVTRNGKPDNVFRSTNGNAVIWRVGRSDIFLDPGTYAYQFTYTVPRGAIPHDDKSEVYWNATGTFWNFPIEQVRATIRFPAGAQIVEADAYTGRLREAGKDVALQTNGATLIAETTRRLAPGEGLTVAAAIPPGVIAGLTAAEKKELNWIRTGAVKMLGGGGLALFLYYMFFWTRLGRDPVKPPVFPRYKPPAGYSAAAVHRIHFKGLRQKDWLTAILMQLGAHGIIDIEASKKVTKIDQLRRAPENHPDFGPDGRKALDLIGLTRPGDKMKFDGKPNTSLLSGIMRFGKYLNDRYGPDYHRRNLGWAMLGLFASLILVIVVLVQPVAKPPLVMPFILAIAVMGFVFTYLLRAPTLKGADIGAEIEGFKLYLETAEKDRINTANPIGDTPPLMSVELYERFLPYAVALGVEKPWTKQFETSMPTEAANYQPRYMSGSSFNGVRAPVDFTQTLNKALTAGVAAAAPISQSSGSGGGFSSGSSGGGFSGGGGGGGGGGGW